MIFRKYLDKQKLRYIVVSTVTIYRKQSSFLLRIGSDAVGCGTCVWNSHLTSPAFIGLNYLPRNLPLTLSDDFIVQLRLTLHRKGRLFQFLVFFRSTDWSCRVTESNSIGWCETKWDRNEARRNWGWPLAASGRERSLRSRYRSLSIDALYVSKLCT
jgi:hypothetical protein